MTSRIFNDWWMVLNYFSALLSHWNAVLFFVRLRNGAAMAETLQMKCELKLAMYRNEWTSATDCDCISAWIFFGAGVRPSCKKITQKKLILGLSKLHFGRCKLSPRSARLCRTWHSVRSCSAWFCPLINMSSYMLLTFDMAPRVYLISSWNTLLQNWCQRWDVLTGAVLDEYRM